MLKTRAGDIVGSGAPGLFPGQTEQDVLLSREEVAAYLRVSLPTLELWARNGEGPKMVRVGRGCRYRLSDVRAFVEGAPTDGRPKRNEAPVRGCLGDGDRLGREDHQRE
jgi:excisionase family DNA binding protein